MKESVTEINRSPVSLLSFRRLSKEVSNSETEERLAGNLWNRETINLNTNIESKHSLDIDIVDYLS